MALRGKTRRIVCCPAAANCRMSRTPASDTSISRVGAGPSAFRAPVAVDRRPDLQRAEQCGGPVRPHRAALDGVSWEVVFVDDESPTERPRRSRSGADERARACPAPHRPPRTRHRLSSKASCRVSSALRCGAWTATSSTTKAGSGPMLERLRTRTGISSSARRYMEAGGVEEAGARHRQVISRLATLARRQAARAAVRPDERLLHAPARGLRPRRPPALGRRLQDPARHPDLRAAAAGGRRDALRVPEPVAGRKQARFRPWPGNTLSCCSTRRSDASCRSASSCSCCRRCRRGRSHGDADAP